LATSFQGAATALEERAFVLMRRDQVGGRLTREVVEMTDQGMPVGGPELREQAIVRLRKKSEFGAHLLAYLLVNAFLVAIWAVTGAGFFWPAFPLFGWGIGVAFNAWDVYGRKPVSEDQIRREMARMN
jgi:hypothetical protein